MEHIQDKLAKKVHHQVIRAGIIGSVLGAVMVFLHGYANADRMLAYIKGEVPKASISSAEPVGQDGAPATESGDKGADQKAHPAVGESDHDNTRGEPSGEPAKR